MSGNLQYTAWFDDDVKDVKIVHNHVRKNETCSMPILLPIFLFVSSINLGKLLLNLKRLIK